MVGEETSVVTETGTTAEPGREPEKPYVCSQCGAKVVPQRVETPSGITNRCPECGKFMKPLTPTEAEGKKEEQKGPLPPLEVIVTQRVKELLVNELPRVYGIPQKDATKTITAIIDTLTPPAAMNPWNLHSHIKDFASNANDRHLESVINKIFYQLEEEGYMPRDRGYQPRYRERGVGSGYEPRYAWREREPRRSYYDYDDYEDYEPRRYKQAEERRREEEHDLRMKRLEAEILKITRETEGPKIGLQEEVREFIDEKGNVCDPEKAVSVRMKRVPIQTEGYQRSKVEDAEEKRRAEEHELKMKRLEAEILKITRETEGPKIGLHEEVREFIDEKGNVCDPEKAISVRIKRTPIATESTEIKELREEVKTLQATVKDKEISQLREEIKELKEKPESEEIKALKMDLNESRKSIEDLKGTIEAKDKQALLDKIGDLDSRLKDLTGTGTGEWKSDEIRLIKGSITDIKDLLQTYLSGERPLDRAERILTGEVKPKPSPEMAGEAERGGVIQELRKHGLVTKIIERTGR